MDITQEKLEEQNALLKVVVEPQDYSEKYKTSLKDYGKQMNMPGFRPGKVPVSLVRSKYGKALLVEEIERLVSDRLNSYISENNMQLLGGVVPTTDQPVRGDWDNPGVFEFFYEVGLKPELDVKVTDKDKLTYYNIAVDDKKIDEEVLRIARRYGKLRDVEAAGENDMLLGDFVELDENDEIVPGGIMKGNTISLEYVDDEITKALTGKKPGDEVVIDPRKVADGNEDLARLLGISPHDASHVNTNFKFIVREVKRLDPADFNEELFDKVFGDDVVTTEEEFRQKVADSMQERYRSESDNMFRRDLSNYLVEKFQPTLPDEFLKRWLRANDQMEIDVEAEYPEYRRSTQWQLIVNNLIEKKEIELENKDIVSKTVELLREQYAQYGIPDPDPAQLESSARQVLSDEEEANKVSNLLINEKLVEYARGKAKVEEKDVNFDKFAELASKGPAETVNA